MAEETHIPGPAYSANVFWLETADVPYGCCLNGAFHALVHERPESAHKKAFQDHRSVTPLIIMFLRNAFVWAAFLFLVLFVLVDSARSEGGCLDNSDCPADSYCRKVDGDCQGTGVCQGKPEVCLTLWDPVCGCDGLTYSNNCTAALAGVGLMHSGECQGIDQASVTGMIHDKMAPRNDTLYMNLKKCSGLSEAIASLENERVTIQVGPLVMDIPWSDFVLAKTGYFLYYHPGKMAGEETIKLRLVPISDSVTLYCGNTWVNGIINPITVKLTIGEWSCQVTREWEELPYSTGVKYRAREGER